MKTVWKFLSDVWVQYGKLDVYRMSASLVLTSTLSLIPVLTVFLGFAEMFGGFDKAIREAQPLIFQYIAPGTAPEFIQNLEASVDRSRGRVVGLIGIALLIWTVTSLLIEIQRAFRTVAGTQHAHFDKKYLAFEWLTILLGPLAIVSVSIVTSVWKINSVLPNLGIWVFGYLILFMMFRSAYAKAVPNKEIAVVTFICSAGIIVSEKVFIWASKSIFSYGEIYGSIAFLPLFLIWLSVFWNVVLISVLIGRWLIRRESTTII